MLWYHGDLSAMALRLYFIGGFALLCMGLIAIVLALKWLKQKATGAQGSRSVANEARARAPDWPARHPAEMALLHTQARSRCHRYTAR